MDRSTTEPFLATRPVHRLARRHLPLLLLWFPGTGCGVGWQAQPIPLPAPLPSRQQAQVWRSGAMTRLHGIVLTGDSLSGIPYLQPLSCDSCRVVVPLRGVDSLRTGDPVGSLWAVVALFVATLLLVACASESELCPGPSGT